MKTSLRVGAPCAPDKKVGSVKSVWPIQLKRAAGAATALVLVSGVGASSAIFVDYLADRAKLRAYAAATRNPAADMKNPAATAPAPTTEIKPSLVAAGPETKRDAAAVARVAKAAAAEGSLPLTGEAKPIKPQTLLQAPLSPSTVVTPKDAPVVSPSSVAAAVPLEDIPPEDAINDPEPLLAGDDVGDQTVTSAIPSQRPEQDASAGQAEKKDTGRVAKVLKYVNLRSRPADESKVLTVVPAKASVNVLSCKSWCEVEYAGTKGFIYKRFIGKT